MKPSAQTLQAMLAGIPMFADCPPDLLNAFLPTARVERYARGEIVFGQGEGADRFVCILSGQVHLVQHTADGRDVTMATFTSGDVIGLIVAFIGEPFPGSAMVIDDSEVLILSADALKALIPQCAALAFLVIQMLAKQLIESHNRIRELSAERVQQRLARTLLRLAEKSGIQEAEGIRIDLRLSRQDLAQMNGTTLETVSRTLTVWERAGIILSGRESITICDLYALSDIAEDLPNGAPIDLRRNLICIKDAKAAPLYAKCQ
jgi:CRP-like cAMP-binding protein